MLYFPSGQYDNDVRMAMLQYEFGQIFSPTDIRYFLGFYDAGSDIRNIETQKRMLCLIYQEFFKVLFDQMADETWDSNHKGNLADLTGDGYLT